MTTFEFHKQLSKGKEAEQKFLSICPWALEPSNDRSFDFIRTFDGAKVELKTEFRTVESTPNFFIERWSNNGETKKPGSFWQSQDKAEIIIYFFPLSNTYFEFTCSIKEMIPILEKYITEKKLHLYIIKNRGYEGAGYCIPRAVLKDYFKEVKYGT